ncbi:MAG: helix-turn-helix transcriptional regulator [Caldilineaceae bacterium]|nr:helix-turn-helix transcriptional regulator [Caldilineaceae bacterium]
MLQDINDTSCLDLLKLLLDEDRLRVLGMAARQPCAEQTLAADLGIKPGALMRHLRQLRQAGLLTVTVEDGQENAGRGCHPTGQACALCAGRCRPARG